MIENALFYFDGIAFFFSCPPTIPPNHLLATQCTVNSWLRFFFERNETSRGLVQNVSILLPPNNSDTVSGPKDSSRITCFT